MKGNFCHKCDLFDPLYREVPCPHGGGFGKIGQHVYNIHVTAATYKCQCGTWMGRFSSWPPDGQKDIDPFGACPVRGT